MTNKMRTEWRQTQQPVPLTAKELLPWDHCSICLNKAKNPTCCPSGDVFCRECALELLLQKQRDNHRKVKCPVCGVQLKLNRLFPLRLHETADGVLCVACSRPITGDRQAVRLSCSDVMCAECFKGLRSSMGQCPSCGDVIRSDIRLNQSTTSALSRNGVFVASKESLPLPFG